MTGHPSHAPSWTDRFLLRRSQGRDDRASTRRSEKHQAADSESEAKIIEIRNVVLLAMLSFYLVLNQGFMLIRIPPAEGGGVPIGEIVLILSLLTINYRSLLPRLAMALPLLPLILFWAYGFTRMAFDFLTHGMWALRDAVQVIESLFLLVGFAFAGSPRFRAVFFRWFIAVLCVGTFYTFLLPWEQAVTAWSPTIMAATGREIPILGLHASGKIIAVAFAIFLLLRHEDKLVSFVSAMLILIFVLTFYQQRITYGVVAAALIFLAVYRKRHLKTPLVLGLILFVVVGSMSLLGVEIRGFKGQPITFDFMYALGLASFGIATGSDSWVVWSAAGGALHRFEWWTSIIERLMASPLNLFFGLGYGIPLTDQLWHGVSLLREPHNSYISVLGRGGIIGFALWCWLHVHLLLAWNSAYRWSKRTGPNRLQEYLLVVMVVFIGIWVMALGEDPLEKPYYVIPYYFLWGVVLRFAAAAGRDQARRENRRRRSKWQRSSERPSYGRS